jgi:hypothetical protein
LRARPARTAGDFADDLLFVVRADDREPRDLLGLKVRRVHDLSLGDVAVSGRDRGPDLIGAERTAYWGVGSSTGGTSFVPNTLK